MSTRKIRGVVDQFNRAGDSIGRFELSTELWGGRILIHAEPLDPQDTVTFSLEEVTATDLRDALREALESYEKEEE